MDGLMLGPDVVFASVSTVHGDPLETGENQMEQIRFRCPDCGKILHAPQESLGSKGADARRRRWCRPGVGPGHP